MNQLYPAFFVNDFLILRYYGNVYIFFNNHYEMQILNTTFVRSSKKAIYHGFFLSFEGFLQ